MKKITTLLLVLLTLSIFTTNIYAQEETDATESTEEIIATSGITVSPPTIEISQGDLGKKYTIEITNNTESAVTFTASEEYVQRNDQKQTEIIEREDSNMLDFIEEPFSVAPGETYPFTVRVKLSVASTDGIYPAIAFTESGDESDLNISSQIMTVFLVQNFDGEASVDTNIELGSSMVTSSKVTISGDILNDGSKYYRPTGTIKVLKGETVLYEKQLTTQIEGLLFPNESVDYEIEWENDENPFTAFGTYTVEVSISPTPFSATQVARIQYIYIPIELIGAVIGGIVVLVGIGFGITKLKKKKQK